MVSGLVSCCGGVLSHLTLLCSGVGWGCDVLLSHAGVMSHTVLSARCGALFFLLSCRIMCARVVLLSCHLVSAAMWRVVWCHVIWTDVMQCDVVVLFPCYAVWCLIWSDMVWYCLQRVRHRCETRQNETTACRTAHVVS